MRILSIAAAAALGLSAVACTEAQREDAGAEAKQAVDAAGSELEQAVENVDLEQAAEKTKDVASDVGGAVKDAAGDFRDGAERAGEGAKEEAAETTNAARQ